MFLKFCSILFFLLSLNIMAGELSVASRNGRFILSYNNEKISLKGHLLDLNIHRNQCNKKILSNFNSKIKLLLKTKALLKSKVANGFKYTHNGETYYEGYKSRLGQNILNIPKELQRMKLEEKYKCLSKNNPI